MNITTAIAEHRRHAAAFRRIEVRRLASGPFRANGTFRFVGDRTAVALDAHRSAMRRIQGDLFANGLGRLGRALLELSDALELLPYAGPKGTVVLRTKIRTEREVIRKLAARHA